MLWIRLTPYSPPQQCAAIIRRLTGAAREAARSISADEIENGGYLNGQYYDPVSYLLAGLELRFGNLDEEQRQMAANELHAFRRHQGETTDELLSRYSIVRNRARLEGNVTQSVEQNANQLLRAVGV